MLRFIQGIVVVGLLLTFSYFATAQRGTPNPQGYRELRQLELESCDADSIIVLPGAFSPDNNLFAAPGRFDRAIGIWDTRTGSTVLIVRDNPSLVAALAWSPDSSKLASGGGGAFGHEVRVWDIMSGENISTFAGHQNAVRSLAWSPDGRMLLSGSWDNTIRIWDIATEQLLVTYEVIDLEIQRHFRDAQVETVSWSYDDSVIAAGSTVIPRSMTRDWSGLVTIWHDSLEPALVRSETPILSIDPIGTGPITAMTWIPDSQLLVVGDDAGFIWAWNKNTTEVSIVLDGHGEAIHMVSTNPDGTRIAGSSDNGTVYIWDVDAFGIIAEIPSVGRTALGWNQGGTNVFTAGSDCIIHIWEVLTVDP